VLVSMPFMDARRPSIQLGLLKALATARGFPARTFHANLDFAAQVGLDYYQLLSQHRGPSVGEWLFSVEAFQDEAPDPGGRLIKELASDLSYLADPAEGWEEKLLRTRRVEIPSYLDNLIETFPWAETAIVGFSSTFQQNSASFALARRLKQRYPHIFTVFGGANFDGEMGLELVRRVDCIDAAVVGEGDDAFPGLLAALAEGSDPGLVPGVARRQDGQVTLAPPLPPKSRLDDLPTPDYAEFFQHAEELGVMRPGNREIWIPIETARGCWWGARHHCTFCGLNGTTMEFRAKSPGRVTGELEELARRYRSWRFEAVDNILDMTYLTKLFPELIESDTGYQFFYEVKSNLSRAQLKLLARGGVTHIQPGLESLSSNVLRLMRKGTRAAQNVNLLRWAQYYGISASWNLLWGFPGETEQDYADQAAIMPHLVHLPPPASAGPIWLERFSPLFTGDGGVRPVHDRTPEASYRYVYPRDVDLEQVAYFFDYQVDGGLPDGAYAGVRRMAAAWSDAWLAGRRPTLTYSSAPHFVQISDRRQPGQGGTFTFEGTLADLYLACRDRPATAAAVRRELDLRLPEEAVQEIFAEFQQRGLMLLDGELALALALPAITAR
jgi:ribosomal peptide maturation radical SAM protein 1